MSDTVLISRDALVKLVELAGLTEDKSDAECLAVDEAVTSLAPRQVEIPFNIILTVTIAGDEIVHVEWEQDDSLGETATWVTVHGPNVELTTADHDECPEATTACSILDRHGVNMWEAISKVLMHQQFTPPIEG